MNSPLRRLQLPAAVLLLGGLLAASAPLIGVAQAHDGGRLSYAVPASLVPLLPGLVALVCWWWRPGRVAPLVAGAGLMWTARLAADLGAMLAPRVAERADLMYETAGVQRPLGIGPGIVVLLLGDLVMVAAGVLAMRDWAADRGDRHPESRRPTTVLGILALLGLTAGYLLTAYSGGYLATRPVTASVDFGPVAAAVVMLAVGGVLLLLVTGHPRAWPLLAGAAVAAAAPCLAALLVGVSGAGVSLGSAPWVGVAAAVVLGVAGVLRLPGTSGQRAQGALGGIDARSLTVAGAVAGVLAAGCSAAAWRLPAVVLNGVPERTLGARPTAGVGDAFLFAAVVSAAAAVLALLPRIGRIGRSAQTLLWAPSGAAVSTALADLSVVSVGSGAAAIQGRSYQWTAGAGTWWGTAGFVLALMAGGAALLANRQQDEDCLDDPDPDELAEYREHSRWVAVGLTALTILVGVLPVFTTALRAGPTALPTSGVDGVGVDLLTVAMMVGATALGWSHRRGQLIGLGIASAVIGCQRLLIPHGAPGMQDYHLAAGYMGVWILAAALLLATGWQYLQLRGVRLVDQGFPVAPSGSRRDG